MDRENSGETLQSLITAIKSSEHVEARIQLVKKLGVAVPLDDSDVDALLNFLTTLWEGFTCLDVSQCMLNKAILEVASKYLGGSTSCQGKLLTLGGQASEWCVKHLQMTLISSGDSQEEEHYDLFFQMLVECLRFCGGCLSSMIGKPMLGDEQLMGALDKFLHEQLNLVKDLVTGIKKIHALTSELVKEAEGVLDSLIKLCKTYSQAVNWDLHNQLVNQDSSNLNTEGAAELNHVTNLVQHTIEKLSELGVLAADSGGSLVTILNLSWKGVVSLLQLGGGILSGQVCVERIILSLISLAADSLKCATETWSSSLDKIISANEAKRAFLPIKFYLINAVRISSQYPLQAFSVYREVTRCILLLTTLRVTFSKEMILKNVCEAMEELLKPTSLHLLKSLLSSAQLSNDQKLEILDWLFSTESCLVSPHSNQIANFQKSSFDEVFSLNYETIPSSRILLLGRVVLFADLLKVIFNLDVYVILCITRKLQWFLDALVVEEVYCFALVLRIPVTCGEGKSLILTWEPIWNSFLHSLKIFMILVSETQAWSELEFFLLDNFFHHHFLCREIILELWCFLVRHADSSTVDVVMDKLCSLYKLVAQSVSPFSSQCELRKMARSMCLLLASCAPSTVDRIYRSILTDNRSHLSVVMHAALLMEGFQLILLSDDLRVTTTERIYLDYARFADEYIDNPMYLRSLSASGTPVAVLCSALQSMQIDASGLDKKTIKLLLAALRTYKKSTDSVVKSHCCRLISEALGIISTAKHLFGNDQLEHVIIELENLFISGPTGGETEIQKCKPALASFMSSLCHMDMTECDTNVKTSAIWQLYHMLLRERHWALIHLAILAFGNFAARTSCSQLWRFVPQDAALSFDLESGQNANEEAFMNELKVFLEREMALPAAAASGPEQLELVIKDGLILRELYQKNSYVSVDSAGCEVMEADGGNISNKRRKLPDGFCRGIEFLQNGLKIIGDGLSQCQQDQQINAELDDKIFIQFTRLEEVVNHLAGMADGR